MKPHKKKIFDLEVPRTKGKKKKANKPWQLERKFKNKEAYLDTFEGQFRPNNYVDGWVKSYEVYMSPEHAKQQLSKYVRHWWNKLQGSSWRIGHKDTGEVYYLEATENKIILKEFKN